VEQYLFDRSRFSGTDEHENPKDGSLYALIWNALNKYPTAKELADDMPFTFITYNYDRSLEHYLYKVMENFYCSQDEAFQQIIYDNIFHVHGCLGEYRSNLHSNDNCRNYVGRLDEDHVKLAANQIKVIHEVKDLPSDKEIQQRLHDAQRIVFLGCAFWEDNIKRLFDPYGEPGGPLDISTFGSTHGLTYLEANMAKERLTRYIRSDCLNVGTTRGKVPENTNKMKCCTYLREAVGIES
jgi:hypothetical protein